MREYCLDRKADTFFQKTVIIIAHCFHDAIVFGVSFAVPAKNGHCYGVRFNAYFMSNPITLNTGEIAAVLFKQRVDIFHIFFWNVEIHQIKPILDAITGIAGNDPPPSQRFRREGMCEGEPSGFPFAFNKGSVSNFKEV